MKMKHLTFAVLFLAFISCKQEKKEETPDVAEIKIKGETVTYTADSTSLQGYISYDEAKTEKRPGILIVHEWWGHNDYVRERADMLAELGYVALALDMYGDGKQALHPADAGKFASNVMGNIDLAKARFDAAKNLLKNNPMVDSTKIAAIGYCFGGSVVLTMANAGEDLAAVAAFHSGVALPVMPTSNIKARILVVNGEADPFIPAETVEAFKSKMDSVNADYKYVSFPGVLHAFTSKAADSLGAKFELPLKYDQEADEKSWAELQTLLNGVFQK